MIYNAVTAKSVQPSMPKRRVPWEGREVIRIKLMRQLRYEPDYVLLRSDMTSAVEQERAKRKDAPQRAEGIRVTEEPDPTAGYD